MTSVSSQSFTLKTDTWVRSSWAGFAELFDRPELAAGHFYFAGDRMRIEMAPIGSSHSQDDPVVSKVVSVYAALHDIRLKELSNASFRKPGAFEFQPDLAFYIGAETEFPTRGSAPIDLNENEPPTLAIEIASTSLNDDLGQKRQLYEQVGIREYWVIDVKAGQAIAFAISERGKSDRVRESQVLPGLKLAVVEEALQRSQSDDDSSMMRWLLNIFA